MPNPIPPIVGIVEVDDLDALKAFLRPFVPPDKIDLFDSLHRTEDGGLAVKAHGVTVRVSGFIGTGG